MSVPLDLPGLLAPFLPPQRWYAGQAELRADQVQVTACEELLDGDPGLLWALVDAAGERYQVLIGTRSGPDLPAGLHAAERALIGIVEHGDGKAVAYDALLDPELCRVLLGIVAPAESAQHARPVGAEQSNTSVVFDDRLILKVFRRITAPANPDVAVTRALAERGFAHIAQPRGVWQRDGVDLAFLQDFLAGGIEGWALALTSLRDLYASPDLGDPAESGGDFSGEAERLGGVTARMHVAMAEAFGTSDPDVDAWVAAIGALPSEDLRPAVDRLRATPDRGRSIRVHGDYHLGQTMRTDTGWYVLDFEGEPARPVEERQRPSSPLKDVAGMLRSLHYASVAALMDREEGERAALAHLGEAWERRNREAFLAGYLGADGIAALLPREAASREAVLDAFELEKAVYELRYEEQYRPDWVRIPEAALARIAARRP